MPLSLIYGPQQTLTRPDGLRYAPRGLSALGVVWNTSRKSAADPLGTELEYGLGRHTGRDRGRFDPGLVRPEDLSTAHQRW